MNEYLSTIIKMIQIEVCPAVQVQAEGAGGDVLLLLQPGAGPGHQEAALLPPGQHHDDDDDAQLCHARDRLPCSLCSRVFYTQQLLHLHILKLHSN